MAGPLLRVNGFDFSPYMNVQDDSGLDYTDPARIAPQFTGSPALGEGQTYVGSAIANKVWAVPLILDASDRASLKQLMQNIRNNLVQGAQVEYAHDPSVDSSTFFYLEKGTLDETYEYFLVSANTIRVVLHLTTRPFGSTGTMRSIATFTSTSGPQQFVATGILGDTYALANFEVRVGSAVASAGRVIGFGIHQSASFNGVRLPSTGGIDAGQASSTIVGASGAVGSQYLAIPISPTAASGISFTSYLTPPEAHVGRHRVFALARSGLNAPIAMYAVDRFGAVLGPTAQASQTNLTKWQLVDLGEINVPARASGQEAVPTQVVNIYAGGSGAIAASPALQLDSLIYLPLDISPGLMRTPGAAVGQGLSFVDNFDRLQPGYYLPYSTFPVAVPGPGTWSVLFNIDPAGYKTFANVAGAPAGQITIGDFIAGAAKANATAAAIIGSGAQLGDVFASVDVTQTVGATAASGGIVEVWAKAVGGASGVMPSYITGAQLVLSPSTSVSVFLASGGARQVVSSAPLQASVASALGAGMKHTLAIRVIGSAADVFMATAIAPGQAPVTGWAHAGFGMVGAPGMYMRTPSVALTGGLYLDNFSARQLGGSALDINAREWFRFEGYPQLRAYQGNASVYNADRAGNFRGVPLRLPPTGSPGASGGMSVVVFQGEVDNFLGNDLIDVRLDGLERFTFFR